MQDIYECRVVGFGSKASGFVLDVAYGEKNKVSFVIKEAIQKEVEEHLEYEEKVFVKINTSEGIEELIKFAKRELESKKGTDAKLMIHSSVLHEMYVRRVF